MPLIKNIAARKTKSGNYKISVPVDDPENTVNSVQVEISYNRGQPIPEPTTVELTTVVNGENERVFSAEMNFSEDASGQSYPMTATMKGARGNIGEPSTQNVTITKAPVPTEA